MTVYIKVFCGLESRRLRVGLINVMLAGLHLQRQLGSKLLTAVFALLSVVLLLMVEAIVIGAQEGRLLLDIDHLHPALLVSLSPAN